MTAIVQLRPDGRYSNPDIARLAEDLKNYLQPEVMWTKQAAAFLDISETKLYQMDRIPFHNLPGISGRVYLRSELIEFIKNH